LAQPDDGIGATKHEPMAQPARTWSLPARIAWIVVPVAVLAVLAAFVLWPRTDVFYSDGRRSWPARPGLGVRSVLWDAGDLIAGLGEPEQDYDPCLSGDGQELYFTRGKAGGDADIYVTYRTLRGWTEPRPLEAVNSPADEIGPALARDGATLYFYSNRTGGEGGYDLYVSRHTDAGWSEPKNLGPRVNGPFNEYDPAVTPDGTNLLFASNRPVEGEEAPDEKTWPATLREELYQNDYDVYAVDLQAAAAPPRRLDDVCSRANDGQPTVSPDGHWLYFASDRAGGQGGYDLWRSRVTVRPLAGFMPPENLGVPVNTRAHELDPAVSLEGFGLYFSSNRAEEDIYALYYARSHEVFQVVRTRRLAVGRILADLSWPLIGLILALIGLALTLLALARLRRRPGLLTSAMMVSLILHLIALSLFTIWQISYRVAELAKQEERFEVAVSIPGLAESELSSRMRAALVDLARLDTVELAVERSDEMTAPEPPEVEEPQVALAEIQPVPQDIRIARLPEKPEAFADPLRPEPDLPPTLDLMPPEPIQQVQPKPVHLVHQAEPPEPRPVALARAEPLPVKAVPKPRPTPVRQQADVPPQIVPVTLPDVQPREVTLPPIEIAEAAPLPVEPGEALDIAPVTSQVPIRPVRIAAEPADTAVGVKPLAAVRAEAPAPRPAAPTVAPAATAPSAQPAIDTTLLTQAAPPPTAADAAAVLLDETPVRGPAIAPADVPRMEALPPAMGSVKPKVPAPHSNGMAETAPGPRAVVVVERAEGPVALAPAPSVAAPAASDTLRVGPDALGATTFDSAVVAAVPSGPQPMIDVGLAKPGPLALPPPTAPAVNLAEAAARIAPRAVLPERPPVVVRPRERLAARRSERPATAGREQVKPVRAEPLGTTAAEPDAQTLLASAVPAAGSVATPLIGESTLAAALPPSAPIEADVSPPPAPLPPKQIYRLRTDPDRKETIEKLGGTPETEKAVRQALIWFARHQSDDGRWDLDGFMKNYDVKGRRADGRGNRPNQDVGVTALAGLAFVGAGHTHVAARGAKRPSEYARNVQNAIDWLIAGQKEDGDLRRRGQMYDHCLATMLLAESFSMTGDERLVEPVKRAVDFTLKAQNPNRGWRYEPRSDNDTSVIGWALMALKSAEIAGFQVPRKSYRWAANWLDQVRKGKHKGLYEYQPGRNPSPAMTAEGLFSEMLIDYQPDSPRTAESVDYILKYRPRWRPQNREDTNFYYWYYATLALHQLGGAKWDEWNRDIRETLVKAQRQDGPFAGSWDPRSRWGQFGGRVYSTAVAALTLEVYYRYLPFYDLRLGNQEPPK